MQEIVESKRGSIIWKGYGIDPDEIIADIEKMKNHKEYGMNVDEVERRTGYFICLFEFLGLFDDAEQRLLLGCY